MMRKRLCFKVITAVFICAMLAVSVGVPLYGQVFGGAQLANMPVASATITAATSYSSFANGFKYEYTNKDLVEAFHAGTGTTDTTEVTVDTSVAQGTSPQNPYVISTREEWQYFVNQMAVTANGYGAGKYFALGADLDYLGYDDQFNPVAIFAGTFFGVGHYFKNITKDWKHLSNSTCALFGTLNNGGVVADLNNQNYYWKDVGYHIGGIVAATPGKTYILNCHTYGKQERAVGQNLIAQAGGILGYSSAAAANCPVVYRCSAHLETAIKIITTSSGNGIGGIVGATSIAGQANNSIAILDCYADFYLDATTGRYPYPGAAIGLTGPAGTSIIRIEGFSAVFHYSDITNSATRDRAGGALCMFYNLGSPSAANFTVKDCYLYGTNTRTQSGAVKTYSMFSSIAFTSSSTSTPNLGSSSNVHYATPYDMWVRRDTTESFGDPLAAVATAHSTTDEVWNLAQTDGKLSKAWTRKDMLGEDYSIKFSPVRNAHVREVTLKYANLKIDSNGDEVDEDVGVASYTYRGGTTVSLATNPTAPDSNHIFLGWTDDKTGNSKPFTDLPDEIYEENATIYAMWGVPDGTEAPVVDATSNASTSWSNFTATQGTTTKQGSASVYYSKGKAVTLTADLKVNSSVMKDPKGVYSWSYQEDSSSAETKLSGTSAAYNKIETVANSGIYKYSYVYYSASEPLWRASGTGASIEVTVNPAPIKVQSFTAVDGEHPYDGMRYMYLSPNNIVMVDNDGNVVAGTAAWAGAHAADKIQDPDGDGYAEQLIEFTPDDANYQTGSSYTYTVKLKIEYLTISFVITGVVNKTITHNLEYNQNYTYTNVADMFDAACAANNVTVPDGFVPSFTVGSDKYSIDKYRKLKNSDNSLTAYKDVTSSVSLPVEFVEGTFSITYDPNLDGDEDATTGDGVTVKGGLYYGKRPERVADPVNGSKTFFGWYHNVIDDSGNTESVLWDWDSDVVTEDVTLTAKWLEPSDLISITVKPKTGATFTALTELDLSKITIEAVFKCVVPGEGEQQLDPTTVLISSTNTILTYPTADSILHVDKNGDGTTTVKVRYYADTTNGRKYAEADLILTVDPVLLDTTGWTFNNKTFTYDGNAKSIAGVGTLDKNIKGVTYNYYDENGDPIDQVDVIDIGTYTVIASFTTSADYKVNDRRATLEIAAQLIEVSVTWDSTSFVYNGLQQYPTPTFTVDGTEIELEYTPSGVDNAINAGSYTLTIALTTGGYTIKSGDESVRFTITKAVLPTPTLKDGDIIYKGANIDLTDFLEGFNPDIMEIVSGGDALNAGSYSAVIKFKTDAAANCSWQSGSGSTVNVKWEIKKAAAIADWGNNYKFVWDGSDHRPELIGIIDVFDIDQPAVDLSKLIYEGDINVSDMGSYTITVRVPSSEDWFKNYTLENTSFDFVIVPTENVELVSIVWDNLVLVYNGEIQAPTYTVVDMDGNPVSADVLASIVFEIPDSKWAGDYTAKANVKEGANYFIRSGGTCAYKITTNAQGEGVDPNGSNNGGSDGGSGIKDFFEKLLASHFPLWQVATMAVAALLSLIFIIKAAQYGGRAKKAKNEAKKISARTYASFLPIFSGEVVALGLSNQIWSIMAFAFAGFCLLMLLVMLINRSRWKKAELAKENAIEDSEQRKIKAEKEEREAEKQERIAFQERMVQAGGVAGGGDSSLFEQRLLEMEARHREEMERRDEAMKMMLANLMGGRPQGEEGFAYASMDDTDMLVQRVIAGLLPAVQQMMPEATAYLAAPQEQNEELIALVEEQKALMEEQRAIVEEQNDQMRNMAEAHSEEMRNMSDQISELQEQLAAALSQERADAVILPDSSEDINALTAQIASLQEQIANMSGERADAVILSDNNDEILAQMNALREQIANLGNQSVTVVAPEGNNGEIMAEMNAMREQIAKLSQTQYDTVILDEEDDDFDDEEEWDSILDEDDNEEFAESVIVESDGTVRKVYPNFRMRLKQSSDKNREWYTAIKNLFCSQKGVTYRVYKRVEKIRYQGNVVAVIGIAKRSIKLWLALKPYEYDARRYHHKDVSDKPRFVDVPLYVRVGSDRALTRAQELILALFQEQAMEARKRYTDRSIQELIFTLKYNKLLTNKLYKRLLCESIHVHDCNALDNETAEKCIEKKNVDFIDSRVIETVKLDDIDAKFQDGNRVTLDRLRKVGLVSANCTGYNVAAGHRLTKPLIIVANDFSMEAVKMIALTGGRVVKLNKV